MSSKLSKSKRLLVYQKLEGYCAYCGSPISLSDMTVEHIQPRISGGTNELSNLLPVCKPCNSSKGKKTIDEYRFFMRYRSLWLEQGFSAAQIRWLIEHLDLNKRFNFPEHTFYFEKHQRGDA